MTPKPAAINLLKTEEKTLLEKILTWTLTVGRVLVILTEAIALGAFVYRFGLDMQLVDIRDKIKNYQGYIESRKQDEQLYRDIQTRLAIVKKYDTEAANTKQLIQDVITVATGRGTFTSLAYSDEALKIDITMLSRTQLAGFIAGLKTLTPITAISIDKLEDKSSSGSISTQITATLNTTILATYAK